MSYLNEKQPVNRTDDTSNIETDNDLTRSVNKKSVDVDFRQKYKTEICKFWELNKECRYGNNVIDYYFMKSVRLLTVWKISAQKQMFLTITKLKSASNFMTLDIAHTVHAANFCIMSNLHF